MFNSSCHKGKVRMEKPQNAIGTDLEYPDFLRQLMSNLTYPNHPNHPNFRQNIRSYNSSLSFVSKETIARNFVFSVHATVPRMVSGTIEMYILYID